MKRILLFCALLLSACSRFEPIDGNGIITTRRMPHPSATSFAINGNCKIILRQGKEDFIELNGDSNILSKIKTETIKGICTTTISSRLHPRADLVLTVSAKRFDSLTLNGNCTLLSSGTLRGKSLKICVTRKNSLDLHVSYDTVEVNARDDYYLLLKGECKRIDFDGAGKGNVDLRALRADRIAITNKGSLTGAGSARKTLQLKSFGEIDFAYTGNPKIIKEISGRGNIRRIKTFNR